MSVRIITDSGSDIERGVYDHLDILPLSVAFGTTVYSDGIDLSRERFYELLVEGDDLPTTGQVTPYAFEQAGRAALEAGDDVVFITLSSKLSGTYQAAATAAEALADEAAAAGRTVRAVDSLSVTVGEQILVKHALQMLDEGKGANEIADEIEALRGRVVLVALLDTLEYLKRGGRISAAAGAVGELLSIKPVIAVEEGVVAILGKARGSKNGRNLLRQQIEGVGGIDFGMPAMVGYTGLSDKLLRKYLEDSRSVWEGGIEEGDIPRVMVGATIGTHVGPGAIAVAFFRA